MQTGRYLGVMFFVSMEQVEPIISIIGNSENNFYKAHKHYGRAASIVYITYELMHVIVLLET